MKTSALSLRRARALIAAVLGLATLSASHAHAQARITVSGGLGMPLKLTLNAPVTYVVTTASNDSAPAFNFQSFGNLFGSFSIAGVTGTITFTVNGGAAQALSSLSSGVAAGSVAATDVYVYGALPGVAVGNVVILNAGMLTTTANFASAPPASGSYQTFLFDNSGNKLDAVNGVSVIPEPSTWATVALGAGGLGVVTLRRRTRGA